MHTSVFDDMSPREIEIAKFIAQGRETKYIARQLSIAENTIKVHLKSMYRKLQVANRVQLAVLVDRELRCG